MVNLILQRHLLEKMLRKKIIGSKHIRIENILSSIPRHEIQNLKTVIEELLKKEYLIWYNKNKKAIQLNIHRIKEIKEFIINTD